MVLDLNLPPPSEGEPSEPLVEQQPCSKAPEAENGGRGDGVRVAKVRPRKLVKLATIRSSEESSEEKQVGAPETPAPAPETPAPVPAPAPETPAPAPAPVTPAPATSAPPASAPDSTKKAEKLGKKRGRQTVRLEFDESLQIARPAKVQSVSRAPPAAPPPLHAPRPTREREIVDAGEPEEEPGSRPRREPGEVPVKERPRDLKPQFQRPSMRKNNEEQFHQRPKQRQGQAPRRGGGGGAGFLDTSVEKLHREATCIKLWQQSGQAGDTELQRVPGSFDSLEDYVQVFEPLLFEECRAQLYNAWEEIGESGRDLHMSAYIKSIDKRDRGWYDIVVCPADSRKRFVFKEGEVAVLSTASQDRQRRGRNRDSDEGKEEGEISVRVAGIIRRYMPLDVRETHGAVLFVNFSECKGDSGYPTHILDDLRQKVPWSLTTLGSLATTQREYLALHAVSRLHPQMINAILQPRPELFPRYDEEQAGMLTCFTPPFTEYLHRNFNPPQLSAIHWAAMHTAAGTTAAGKKQESWPFSLVQGPPGTGKTHTVWGMLNAIHLVQYQRYYTALLKKIAPGALAPDGTGDDDEQGGWIDEVLQKMDRSLTRMLPKLCPKPRMLVCAPSNAATDELLSRVLERGFMDGEMRTYRPDVARVGTDPQTKAAQAVSVEKRTENLVAKSRDEVVTWLQQMRAREFGLSQSIAMIQKELNLSRLQGSVGVEPEAIAARDQARDSKLQHLASLLEDRDKLLVEMSRFLIVENLSRPGGAGCSVEDARAKLEASFANEAEIVFTTVSSSGRKLFTNLARGFDIVVIDEAAQASELGVLPPLILGAARCVLVGDPQQLPATVISRVADTMQYSRSLFERFQQAGCPTLLLTVQYRMHPQIREFPSRHFYQGRLQDSESVRSSPDEIYHHDPLLQPYLFFDVSHGKESHMNGSVSYQNVVEAKFAARLYEHLQGVLKAAGKGASVGVISPYKLQLRCIQKEFETMEAKGVYINTVDAFQGQERDVIIMSCVRASNHGVGFVADIRRMNVALTRARRALWVIGNASTLLQSEDWAALIADAKARNCFVTYSAAVDKGLIADGFLSQVMKEPKSSGSGSASGGGGDHSLRIGGGELSRSSSSRGGRRSGGGRNDDGSGGGERKGPQTAESYLRQHNSLLRRGN